MIARARSTPAQKPRGAARRTLLLVASFASSFEEVKAIVKNDQCAESTLEMIKPQIHEQIQNLKKRLLLVKQMQGSGIISFFLCVLCMLFIFLGYQVMAYSTFGLSLLFLLLSLGLSLNEILISTKALEIELSDVEDLGSNGFIDYIKSRFEKDS